MRYVVDASVAAKWLAPELGSDEAAALLDADLFAPDLIHAEVANIFWKKRQRAEIDDAAAALAVRWMAGAPIEVTPSRDLSERALALAVHLRRPVYDCLYVALALREGCPLVTADIRLAHACQRSGSAELAAAVTVLQNTRP